MGAVPDELKQVLDVAAALKPCARKISPPTYLTAVISVFSRQFNPHALFLRLGAKPAAFAQQGLDEGKSQIAHGETVRETANMIAFCADALSASATTCTIGAGNAYARGGRSARQQYRQGVLPQRPALINLQCDIDHPTQAMADLAWLQEHFGSLRGTQRQKSRHDLGPLSELR